MIEPSERNQWYTEWQRIRAGGRLRYVLLKWGATYGLPAGVVTTILPGSSGHPVSMAGVIANIVGWFAGMCLGGALAWTLSERKYLRYSNRVGSE
jgi:hypothetical protein